MTGLDPSDARRIRGVLGRLLSDSDGERLAAVDALVKLCGRNGLSVMDLVPEGPPASPSSLDPKAERRARYPEPAGAMERQRLLRDHQREAWLLLISQVIWNEWERQFLTDLRHKDAPITPRQQEKLRQLRQKASELREGAKA